MAVSLTIAKQASGGTASPFPDAARYRAIFGQCSCLKPSVRTRSASRVCRRISSSVTGRQAIMAYRLPEAMATTSAPARAKRQVSLPG